jgi:hypothetical protein
MLDNTDFISINMNQANKLHYILTKYFNCANGDISIGFYTLQNESHFYVTCSNIPLEYRGIIWSRDLRVSIQDDYQLFIQIANKDNDITLYFGQNPDNEEIYNFDTLVKYGYKLFVDYIKNGAE